jgi:hypothetical protein
LPALAKQHPIPPCESDSQASLAQAEGGPDLCAYTDSPRNLSFSSRFSRWPVCQRMPSNMPQRAARPHASAGCDKLIAPANRNRVVVTMPDRRRWGSPSIEKLPQSSACARGAGCSGSRPALEPPSSPSVPSVFGQILPTVAIAHRLIDMRKEIDTIRSTSSSFPAYRASRVSPLRSRSKTIG